LLLSGSAYRGSILFENAQYVKRDTFLVRGPGMVTRSSPTHLLRLCGATPCNLTRHLLRYLNVLEYIASGRLSRQWLAFEPRLLTIHTNLRSRAGFQKASLSTSVLLLQTRLWLWGLCKLPLKRWLEGQLGVRDFLCRSRDSRLVAPRNNTLRVCVFGRDR